MPPAVNQQNSPGDEQIFQAELHMTNSTNFKDLLKSKDWNMAKPLVQPSQSSTGGSSMDWSTKIGSLAKSSKMKDEWSKMTKSSLSKSLATSQGKLSSPSGLSSGNWNHDWSRLTSSRCSTSLSSCSVSVSSCSNSLTSCQSGLKLASGMLWKTDSFASGALSYKRKICELKSENPQYPEISSTKNIAADSDIQSGEVKEAEQKEFPTYEFEEQFDEDEESEIETGQETLSNEAGHVLAQKDSLIKLVSLLGGDGAKDLLIVGSSLRVLLENSMDNLLDTEPDFILKVALYARRCMNLRLVSNFILANACKDRRTSVHLHKYFGASVRLPSDWVQVASIALGMDTDLKKGNIPTSLRRALVRKFDDFDEYQVAKHNKKPKIDEDEQDPRERNFCIKRLIRTLHISRPSDIVMKVLGKRYPENREEFRSCRLEGTFRPELAGKRMKLEVPETWETELSEKGNKKEVWESLIDNKKLPYLATIRNIRNLLLAGISDSHLKKVAGFISNETMVQRGGMFPFQYFTAYDVLTDLEERKDRKENKSKEKKELEPWQKSKIAAMQKKMGNINKERIEILKKSLDEAVNISARVNIPPLKGRTLVLCAYGRDGDERMTAAKGLLKKGTTARDTCLLYSCMIASRSEDSNLVLFSSSYKQVELTSTTLLSNLENIPKEAKSSGVYTNTSSLGPVQGLLKEFIKNGETVHNIILFHHNLDVQRNRDLINILEIYRQDLNPSLLFTSVNLSGTKAGIEDMIGGCEGEDGQNPRNVYLSGCSDVMLRFLVNNGNGNLIQQVDTIDRKFSLESGTSGTFSPAPLLPTPNYPQWKNIKIFVSSTFLDMQGERNLLHMYVLPILREKCRKLHIKVDLIDLRWGLKSNDEDSTQVESCLQQARAADFFVGILGERYGWVPCPHYKDIQFLQEAGCGHLVDGNRSITELEMEYAALSRTEAVRDQTFFYIRDKTFIEDIPDSARDDFRTIGPENKEYLENLKKRVRASGLGVRDGYTAEYGGRIKGFHIASNLKEFGDAVLWDVWNGIRKLHPPTSLSLPNTVEKQIKAELSTCNHVYNTFIGRKKEIKNIQACLDREMEEETGCVLRLVQQSGAGCTTILRYLAHMYRLTGIKVLPYTDRRGDPDVRDFLHYFLYLLDNKPEPDKDIDSLKISLRQKIQKYRGKLIIILKRLDMLGVYDWIPELLPPGVILLTSCTPEGKSAFKGGNRAVDLKIGFMDLKDRLTYLRSQLTLLGKELEENAFTNQVRDIVQKKEGGSPTYINTVIRRLVQQTSHSSLTQDIHGLGATMQELLVQQLETAESIFGRESTTTFIRIIYLAKHGINLSDLQTVMSFLMCKDREQPVNIEGTRREIIRFMQTSDKIYPTLDLISLINQLDVLVYLSSGTYHLPSGIPGKVINDRYIRLGRPEAIKQVNLALAAIHLHSYNSGADDPNVLKSLPHHIGSLGDSKLMKDILCSSSFCRKMSSAGLLGTFLDQLQGDCFHLKRTREKFSTDQLVRSWTRFVISNLHLLSSDPELCNQLLVNQPSNSHIFQDFIQSGSQHTNQDRKLIEWVNRRQEEEESSRVVIKKQDKFPTVLKQHNNIVFVGYSDGVISVINSETFREGVSLIGHVDEVTGLAMVSKNTLLSASADGQLASWDLQKKLRLKRVAGHNGRIVGLQAENFNIVTGGWDGVINIWNIGLTRLSQISANHVPLNDILLHPYKNFVIVACWDNSVRVFDLDSKEQKAKISVGSSVQRIALSEDASKLGLGTLAGRIEIWDSSRGVELAARDIGSTVSSLRFTEHGELLVGTGEGNVICVDYNQGTVVDRPLDRVADTAIRMADSLHQMFEAENLTEVTSLRRHVTALHVIEERIQILGFDNGDVEITIMDHMPSRAREGKTEVYGARFGDDPIASISHTCAVMLVYQDWSIDPTVDEEVVVLHNTKNAVVFTLASRKFIYLEGIESRIANIQLTDLELKPYAMVYTESSLLFYQLEMFNRSESVQITRLKPAKSVNLNLNAGLREVVFINYKCALGVDSGGNIWDFTLDCENLEVNETTTEISAVQGDSQVVGVFHKNVKVTVKKPPLPFYFVFYSRGTVFKLSMERFKWKMVEVINLNTSGIKSVHTDEKSDNFCIVHSRGSVSVWSPRGVEIGQYNGQYTAAGMYSNQLYLGDQYIHTFNPTSPNILSVDREHSAEIRGLLPLHGQPEYLTASEDGSVKIREYKPSVNARLPSSIVSVETYSTNHILTLTLSGSLVVYKLDQPDNLSLCLRQQLEEDRVYLDLKVVQADREHHLLVITKTSLQHYKLVDLVPLLQEELDLLFSPVVAVTDFVPGHFSSYYDVVHASGRTRMIVRLDEGRIMLKNLNQDLCSKNGVELITEKSLSTDMCGAGVVLRFGLDDRIRVYTEQTSSMSQKKIGEFTAASRVTSLAVLNNQILAGDLGGDIYQLRIVE